MYENITTVILQTNSTTFDVSWIALIIAAVSAGAVAGTFILNWGVSKTENNRKYADLINVIHNQLNHFIEQEFQINDIRNLRRVIAQYLNKVEEIAYLTLKGRLPKDVAEYFHWWLKDGYSILIMLNNQLIAGDVFHKETWQYILDWKNENYPAVDNFKPEGELPIFIERLRELQE